MIEKASEHELHVGQPVHDARADPPPGPKRNKLEVITPKIDTTAFTPNRINLAFTPKLVTPFDRSNVHKHLCPLWHIVTHDLARLGQQEWHRRVQP